MYVRKANPYEGRRAEREDLSENPVGRAEEDYEEEREGNEGEVVVVPVEPALPRVTPYGKSRKDRREDEALDGESGDRNNRRPHRLYWPHAESVYERRKQADEDQGEGIDERPVDVLGGDDDLLD